MRRIIQQVLGGRAVSVPDAELRRREHLTKAELLKSLMESAKGDITGMSATLTPFRIAGEIMLKLSKQDLAKAQTYFEWAIAVAA